ncbi:MaoC family dehydratase [uncultured Croceicoccus sp.]|uniref:MaoC family dehydratase n=1 Tax=uncultured Croceicoccus sp. TaxID=1295329 RepID=UPI00344B4F76
MGRRGKAITGRGRCETKRNTMLYFEDMHVGEEERFGSYRVQRDEAVAFASQFDPQPFHLSEEAARDSMFGRIAASGWHTAAISMRMIVDHYRETGRAMIAGMGVDDLRWTRPVYPGDTLRCETKIVDTRDSKSMRDAGLVTIAVQLFNQDDILVCRYRSAALFRRRPRDAGPGSSAPAL